MKLPTNGRAKALRSYFGALTIFIFIVAIIVVLIQFPVLDSNKEIVMTLIGMLAASLGLVVSTLTGRDPHDVDALKNTIDKKESQIQMLVESKDKLEEMVINLQREMLQNQDNMMDKIILKAAMDFDDKRAAK
mgnify:CR=1 FL=1|tara:strand:- start:619 stop:1017 length:399 start_codon:yes stop_codon:yes gene_type:complete